MEVVLLIAVSGVERGRWSDHVEFDALFEHLSVGDHLLHVLDHHLFHMVVKCVRNVAVGPARGKGLRQDFGVNRFSQVV